MSRVEGRVGATCRVGSGRAALAVEAAGEGDPVVFLHAAVCDRRMWRAQLGGIGDGLRAVAYDRRGFGETQSGTEPFSQVADLMAVIDAAASGAPAILVGCSQGGRIAIDAALRHPARVRALVLIAPSILGAPEPEHPPAVAALMERLAAAERAGDLDEVNRIEAHLWLDGPLSPEGRVAGEVRRLFLEMNGLALRAPPAGAELDAAPAHARLGEIGVPALVMQGSLDFPHIVARSRRMASALPRGTLAEIGGTAHLPSLERPEEVTRAVAAFAGRAG
jgi:pimeloyl-ACP methyl ester carboxylesterase